MNKKINISSFLIPLILAAGIIGGIFIGRNLSTGRLSPEEEKIRMVMNLIRDQYVDEVDTDSSAASA